MEHCKLSIYRGVLLEGIFCDDRIGTMCAIHFYGCCRCVVLVASWFFWIPTKAFARNSECDLQQRHSGDDSNNIKKIDEIVWMMHAEYGFQFVKYCCFEVLNWWDAFKCLKFSEMVNCADVTHDHNNGEQITCVADVAANRWVFMLVRFVSIICACGRYDIQSATIDVLESVCSLPV